MKPVSSEFLLAGAALLGLASPSLAAESRDPRQNVGRANDAARVQPERATFLNAIQKYAWAEGALYQVYASPGQVTDIVLQEGEELVGPGPVAAGDTVRWIIGDTVSGSGSARRVHILVKPTRPDIVTNIVINTSRRTYHIELRATPATYMASVSWSYPEAELIALRMAEAERERTAPVAAGLDLGALNFRYRLSGDKPGWRPVRVFATNGRSCARRSVFARTLRGLSFGRSAISSLGASEVAVARVAPPYDERTSGIGERTEHAPRSETIDCWSGVVTRAGRDGGPWDHDVSRPSQAGRKP